MRVQTFPLTQSNPIQVLPATAGRRGFKVENLNENGAVLVRRGQAPVSDTTTAVQVLSFSQQPTRGVYRLNINGQRTDEINGFNPVDVVAAIQGDYQRTFPFGAYLDQEGNAYTWGINTDGAIGDGTTTHRSSPVAVIGGKKFKHIFMGGAEATTSYFGIDEDGNTWAWGDNTGGKLGDGTNINRSSPVAVIGGLKFVQIACGSLHTVGLTVDGLVYAWGFNSDGALGQIDNLAAQSSPVAVLGLNGKKFKQVAAIIDQTSLALEEDGSIWAWGKATNGVLGDGTTVAKSSPVAVIGGRTYKCISGTGAGFAITTAGALYAWGNNTNGILGTGNVTLASSPVLVAHPPTDTFQDIRGGQSHVMALAADGSIYAWGLNTNGRLGDGTTTSRSSPVAVIGGHRALAIAVGPRSSQFLGIDNKIYTFGINTSGEMGDGTVDSKSSPVAVTGQRNWRVANAVPGLQNITASSPDDGVGVVLTMNDGPVPTPRILVEEVEPLIKDGTSCVQTITSTPAPSGGTFGLVFRRLINGVSNRYEGKQLAYDASAATIQEYLRRLTLDDGLTVSGTLATAITVTFGQHGEQQKLEVVSKLYTAETQVLEVSELADKGSFKLRYKGQTTTAIPADASSYGASNVQSALRQLAGLENVVCMDGGTGIINVQFVGVEGNVALLEVVDNEMIVADVAEVQHIAFDAVPTGGNWALRYGDAEFPGADLAHDANAAAIQTYLRDLVFVGISELTVSGDYTEGFTVTFAGAAQAGPQPLLVVHSSSLVATATPVETTITEVTPGVSKDVELDISEGGAGGKEGSLVPVVAVTTVGSADAPVTTSVTVETQANAKAAADSIAANGTLDRQDEEMQQSLWALSEVSGGSVRVTEY